MSSNAHLIDGRLQASTLKDKLTAKLSAAFKATKKKPGLAIIRVGDDPASAIYVNRKLSEGKAIGIRCFEYALPETTTKAKLLKLIDNVNGDLEINGVIVQLPLPNHLQPDVIINAIDPQKDVDGLHPENYGRMMQGLDVGLKPCTPLGILHLLSSVHSDLTGQHAVVVGASNLVGMPTAVLLQQRGCTITVMNSNTIAKSKLARQADILVSATGIANLVTAEWIKPGATVIDVGISKDPSTSQIVGDVDFASVSKVAGHITPVPGGVGPMTVAYLLANTYKAFCDQTHIRDNLEE